MKTFIFETSLDIVEIERLLGKRESHLHNSSLPAFNSREEFLFNLLLRDLRATISSLPEAPLFTLLKEQEKQTEKKEE